jgi:hypothetical protein
MAVARRSQQQLTLEQVYQLQSEWKAFHPPGMRRMSQAPLRLTALAQQACLQEGIDPHDLMFREIWQFAEPNVSEEIQLMRHSAYMQLREEKMDAVMRARDAIISVRSDREALAKAVEAKMKPKASFTSTGSDAKSAEKELMTWSGKDFTTLDGKKVVPTASSPKAPTAVSATFKSEDGFAALYSRAHTTDKPTDVISVMV